MRQLQRLYMNNTLPSLMCTPAHMPWLLHASAPRHCHYIHLQISSASDSSSCHASATQMSLRPCSNEVTYRQPISHQQTAPRVSAAASSNDSSSDRHSNEPTQEAEHQYKYIGSNNRRHATMEDAWRLDPSETTQQASQSFGGDNVPWGLGWQASERNLVWNDALRMGLLKVLAAPN